MKHARQSPNQVIAYNLERLRKERGWTARDTAEQLGNLLGRNISVASYSAMERSVKTERKKMFDADEIVAIAAVFKVAIWTLFEPPRESRLYLPGKAWPSLMAERGQMLSAKATPGTVAEQVARLLAQSHKLRAAIEESIRMALAKPYPTPIRTLEPATSEAAREEFK
jgi:transcriptional regulator with XRE-family HTH domain